MLKMTEFYLGLAESQMYLYATTGNEYGLVTALTFISKASLKVAFEYDEEEDADFIKEVESYETLLEEYISKKLMK